MQSLLRWSIVNTPPSSSSANSPSKSTQAIDPAIIDIILGTPDSVLIQQAIAIALDEDKAEDERVQALEELEELVGGIDNANGMPCPTEGR